MRIIFHQIHLTHICNPNKYGGCLHGVMVKAVDCRIGKSEFKLHSHYYIHFQTNTLGKGTIYQPLRSGRIWHKVNF